MIHSKWALLEAGRVWEEGSINKVSCCGEIMENNEGKKLLDFIVRQMLVTFEMLALAE